MGGPGCCDTNPFGKPCADCAFDDHAVHAGRSELQGEASDAEAALDFALRSTIARGEVSGFWRSHHVAEIVRRAGPHVDADTHALVEAGSFMHSQSTSTEILADLEQPGAPVFGDRPDGGIAAAWDPSKPGPEPSTSTDRPKDEEGWTKKEAGLAGENSGLTPRYRTKISGGGRRCCVKKFKFPTEKTLEVSVGKPAPASPLSFGLPPGQSIPVIPITWRWQASAEFIPTKEDKECKCECCIYRRYVYVQEIDYDPKGKGSMVPAPFVTHGKSPGEDCMWLYVLKKGKGHSGDKTVVIPGPPNKPPMPRSTPGVKDMLGPICEGRGKDGKAVPQTTAGVPGDPCQIVDKDRPKQLFPQFSKTVKVKIGFLGVVHDACHNFVIRRIQKFHVKYEGKGEWKDGQPTIKLTKGVTKGKPPRLIVYKG